ncbi:MAG: stage III sporulation protein AE [Clostridiales bacterium]|nr:stage III sporulation protein AE [Clostridiales bacterium]
MKNFIIISLIAILMIIPTNIIKASTTQESRVDIREEIQKIAEEQLDILNIDQWNEFNKNLDNYQDGLLTNANLKETIINLVIGKFELNWKKIYESLGKAFFTEIKLNLSLMAKIFAIAIFTGILSNFKTNFSDSTVGELAWIVCYIMIVILIIQSITVVLNVGKNTIEQMTSFMQILFPALLALLIGMGGIASSGVMQPATALLTGVTGIFLKNIMIPLIFLSTILVLISNINDNISLVNLSKLTRNICSWVLGIVFTIFIGVLSVQGIIAASFDGVSIRTTKYAIETFVPVVGKMFSQTVDVIISSSLMLKNAVGVVGLIVAISICLYPILKILSLMAVYKLSSALLEPISDKRVVNCLNEIGSVLVILLVTLLGIAILFFLTIALLIGLGNITVMMR